MSPAPGRRTVVLLHAHPDDEALLTAGSMALASAAGHRVVLVVATAGEAGLADPGVDQADAGLGAARVRELRASAAILGVSRLELLGHPDSGSGPRPAPGSGTAFADLDPAAVAAVLATLLVEERADVLTIYDERGGYGHPDHVQVHRVGLLAARLAGTPVVLEATVDRGVFDRVVRALRALSRVLPTPRLPELREAFTATAELTHRIDVGPVWALKRAALAAHASQATGGTRTLAWLGRLPLPVVRRAWRWEWFRQVDLPVPSAPYDDLFATLPPPSR